MVEVFLGYPPPKMMKWIDEHADGQSDSTQFVDAVYTEDWVFSDGQEHVITYDTITLTIDNGLTADTDQMFFEDGASMSDVPEFWNMSNDELRKLLGKVVVARYGDLGITAYRKYTPGHWENTETGEWTDGNWSEWQAKADAWNSVEDDGTQWIIQVGGGWGTTAFPENVSHKNANIICASPSGGPQWDLIGIRTWTNTKDAPSA